MSIPRYRTGERVRVIVEGPIVDVLASGVELTVALETPNASYEVTVPTSHVTIERLAPAGGEPQPGQLWADATGAERYAYRSSKNEAVSLFDERGVGVPWRVIHTDLQLGPITRVYPLPDADGPQPGPEGDEQGEPRLRLGDVWGAHAGAGASWRVVDCTAGVDRHQLALACVGVADLVLTVAEVTHNWGTLTLIERAGYRRTARTVPVWQLKLGQVVSHSDWADGAPVRFFEALGDVRDLEITCRPLGWISKITFPAARAAEATLWDEIAGGAR